MGTSPSWRENMPIYAFPRMSLFGHFLPINDLAYKPVLTLQPKPKKQSSMKLKLLLLAGVASLAIVGAKAQPWVYDTLVMGPGYAEDVYYQISSGNKHNVSNANWDLAF